MRDTDGERFRNGGAMLTVPTNGVADARSILECPI
jgi:hypothetical protein